MSVHRHHPILTLRRNGCVFAGLVLAALAVALICLWMGPTTWVAPLCLALSISAVGIVASLLILRALAPRPHMVAHADVAPRHREAVRPDWSDEQLRDFAGAVQRIQAHARAELAVELALSTAAGLAAPTRQGGQPTIGEVAGGQLA